MSVFFVPGQKDDEAQVSRDELREAAASLHMTIPAHEEDDYLGLLQAADMAVRHGDDPASYSGIYGLKPTHGLCPYTGIASLHPLIDHCGPMATSPDDVALLLSVMAGYDGLDPRMTPETPLRHHAKDYRALAARAAGAAGRPAAAGPALVRPLDGVQPGHGQRGACVGVPGRQVYARSRG